MLIPLAYSLRSLATRRTTTVMTALGLGVSVAVLVASLALASGLHHVFTNTADPSQLLVLRKGSTSELSSALSRDAVDALRAFPGVAVNEHGEPLVSPELVQVVSLPSIENPNGMNVTVRGLTMIGTTMRQVHLSTGRWFQPGQREIVVGREVARRHPAAQLGSRVRFGADDWTVVGVIDAGPAIASNEIWGDLGQVSAAYNRHEGVNSVLIRAQSQESLGALQSLIENDQRLGVTAERERDYYDTMSSAGAPLEGLGIVVAVIMAIGAGVVAMNTMFAAVARRAREIGTLRTLGFSRGSILLSFLTESAILGALGGLLGGMLALPLNAVTTGVGSLVSFSEIAVRFRVGMPEVLTGMAFAVAVGAIGGVLPARSAARMEILRALREG